MPLAVDGEVVMRSKAHGVVVVSVVLVLAAAGCGDDGDTVFDSASTAVPVTSAAPRESTTQVPPTTAPISQDTTTTAPAVPADLPDRLQIPLDADLLVDATVGLGAVWVTGSVQGIPYLYRIDSASATVAGAWPLAPAAADSGTLRVATGIDFVWVVLRSAVVRVDPTSGAMESISLGRSDGAGTWLEYPWDVAAGDGSAWVIVVDQSASEVVSVLYRIEPDSGAVSGGVEISAGLVGDLIAMGRRVWVLPEGIAGACRLHPIDSDSLAPGEPVLLTGGCDTLQSSLAAGDGEVIAADGRSGLTRWVVPGELTDTDLVDLASTGLVASSAGSGTVWIAAEGDDSERTVVWGVDAATLEVWSRTPVEQYASDLEATDEALWVIVDEPSRLLRLVPQPVASPPAELEPDCSAAGMPIELPEDPDMPGPVDVMRRVIVEDAVACDFDALADLARPGGFEHSMNPNAPGDPVEYWLTAEGAGVGALAGMVTLLGFHHGAVDDGGTLLYVWPAAAAYDDWESTPATARAELEALFTPEDLERFVDENLYLGQSLAIDETGNWRWYLMPGN